MGIEWWFDVVQKGGAIAAVLLLGALLWMNSDRNKVIADLKAERLKVDALADRVITIATRLDQFLFNERKA